MRKYSANKKVARRCSAKQVFLKILIVHRKTLATEYLPATLSKRGSSTGVFQWILRISKGKDTLWNFSFRGFHEIQFQGHFMKRNTFMKYFYFSIQHSLRIFSSIKKSPLQRKGYRVKSNRKDIVQKIQKYQNLSEWNHVRNRGAIKVHVLTYF